MRTIPEAMAAALATGVTTFAHVWRITRADGAVFGFTDHDQALRLDDLVCVPSAASFPAALEKSSALNVDTASIGGALDAEAIIEDDLKRGLWDGARVDLFRVDWRDPSLRVHLFAGRLGEVRRGENGFQAELRGLQAPLNVPVGRVFSRFCDADVGDARCGIDLGVPSFRASGVIISASSPTVFRASGLSGYADGWFARGRLVWDVGGQSEIATFRQDGADATVELLDPVGVSLAPGDTFAIYAGCDKSFETCRAKFTNTFNFRGFPNMPGNDAIQSGPSASDVLDGSSRQS
ncbi:MAG: DUF2163 domain-containing protein [Terricaulis sp.]